MINYSIIKMELKRSFMSFLIWSLSMGVLMYFIVALYPVVADMYAAIPAEYLEMFGGLPSDIVEYFGMEGAMMIQMLGAIYAAILGFGAINREFQELSFDTIYSLPISRKEFYINKIITVKIQIFGFMVINMIFIILGFITAGPMPNLGRILAFMGMSTLLLMVMGILGFTLAIIIKRGAKAMIALVIPLPLYIIYFIYQLTDNKVISYLQYITPYSFADALFILQSDGSFNWISLVIFLGISIFALGYSFKVFTTKDLLT